MSASRWSTWVRLVRTAVYAAVLAVIASRDALRTALQRSRTAVLYGGYGESGQSMVEYALLAALVAIACMAAVAVFSGGVSQVFLNMSGKISGLGR